MKSLVLSLALLGCTPAFAADAPKAAPVVVAPAAAPASVVATPAVVEHVVVVEASPDEIPVQGFAGQVLEAIAQFGGLPWMGKIALLITLLISSMKVTAIRQLLWDKLGGAKAWVGPGLGLILGILTLAMGGHLTLAGVLAWVSAGAGALILHELLDSLKKVPGLGAMWVSFIDLIMSYLGAAKKPA